MSVWTMVVVVLVAVALTVLLIWLMRRGSQREMQELRNQMNLMRESSEKSIQSITSVFGTQMQGMSGTMQSSLSSVVAEVGNRLTAMNQHVAQRLNENAEAMRSSSKEVNDRIANVQSTFAGLQKQVGEMTEQARQMGELSRSMTELERVLSAPKLRGGFGETQLENLLASVFAREQFNIQYKFASGDVADAVLHFPQGIVAIDSKFSLENFRRIAEADTDAGKKAARREFLKDVRKRIDEIAVRYIRPAEGTMPFALMYIPAENVYYEAIIRDEDENDLYSYCVQKRVMPVSPNSLYAYLQTILVGLNSMRISQRAEGILRELQSLEVELEKFDDVYGKLGTHLRNAARSYDDSTREFARIGNRVQSLAGSNAPEQMTLAGEFKKQAMGSGE
jgi:DNA recombination protein RmuC